MKRHKTISRIRLTALAVIVAASSIWATAPVVRAQDAGDAPNAVNAPSVLDKIRAKQRKMESSDDPAKRWFDNLDTDNNEEVTKQELYDGLRRRFKALDTTGDGFVSPAEYLGSRKDVEAGTRRFTELDSNKDGRLSMEEFASPADWRFDRIDRNLDGKISRSEAQRIFERPIGQSGTGPSSECFYVDRQIIRVDKETAEKFRKLGYPKADCYWTPDSIGEEKTKQQAK